MELEVYKKMYEKLFAYYDRLEQERLSAIEEKENKLQNMEMEITSLKEETSRQSQNLSVARTFIPERIKVDNKIYLAFILIIVLLLIEFQIPMNNIIKYLINIITICLPFGVIVKITDNNRKKKLEKIDMPLNNTDILQNDLIINKARLNELTIEYELLKSELQELKSNKNYERSLSYIVEVLEKIQNGNKELPELDKERKRIRK